MRHPGLVSVSSHERRHFSLNILSSKSPAAFTLAEVLITLGIIGVVAAMTMPSLIEKHKEKELITRTKRAISEIKNAALMAQQETGIIGDYTFWFNHSNSSAKTAQNFARYFTGAKVCTSENSQGCKEFFYKVKYATKEGERSFIHPKIILNDDTLIEIIQNSSCKRSAVDCVQDANGACVEDEDGNITPVIKPSSECAILYIDVNGSNSPNQFGRDAHIVYLFLKITLRLITGLLKAVKA